MTSNPYFNPIQTSLKPSSTGFQFPCLNPFFPTSLESFPFPARRYTKNLPVLLRQLKIWDVIQDTIAGFDMQRIECVTRRVINAELRGVTLWGGVIGLIVGISQSIVLWLLK